jgi:multidrug efflux pump subunit AcrA (membrane-fusion protein)
LREGDKVIAGQLLARVNDAVAFDEVDIVEARVAVAEAELVTTVKTKEEAANRFGGMVNTNKRAPNTYSPDDVSSAKLTYERYVQEEVANKAKVVVAQKQLSQARAQLKMYEIRSPVDGVVKVIHFRTGEAVKRLETVLEILPDDDN